MISRKVATYFFRLFLPFMLFVNLSLALGISFGDLTNSSFQPENSYFGFQSFVNFLNDLNIFKEASGTFMEFNSLITTTGLVNLPKLFSSSLFSPSWWQNFGLFNAFAVIQPFVFLSVTFVFGFILIGYVTQFFMCVIRVLNGYYNLPINHVIEFPDLINNLRNFLPLIL